MAHVPNKDYWKIRAEKNLLLGEKHGNEYIDNLMGSFGVAEKNIATELQAFYGRYATENGISLAEAKSSLSNVEKKSYKQLHEQYMAEVDSFLKLNPVTTDATVLEAYKQSLKKSSSKAYVTKMDELNLKVKHQVEMLYGKHEVDLGGVLAQTYKDGFYTTMYDLQTKTGIGVDFNQPDLLKLQKAVKEKWSGTNYSDSIWKDKTAVLNQLQLQIPKEFIKGKGAVALGHEVAGTLGVKRSNAQRLIRTEMNYMNNKATMDSYQESGYIEKYEYLATLDAKTSIDCQYLDGEVFDLKDGQAGVNMPPMHPYCRSTTIPWFDDDEVEDRVARDKDGKTYMVGKDTTYEKWAKEYADPSYVQEIIKMPKAYEEVTIPPLSFLNMKKSAFSDMAYGGDISLFPTDKYTPNEILTAMADFAKTNHPNMYNANNVYLNEMIGESALTLNFITPYENTQNILALDMKLNNLNWNQSKNKLLFGVPGDDNAVLNMLSNDTFNAQDKLQELTKNIQQFSWKSEFKKAIPVKELLKAGDKIVAYSNDIGGVNAITKSGSLFFDLAHKNKILPDGSFNVYKEFLDEIKSDYKLPKIYKEAYIEYLFDDNLDTLQELLDLNDDVADKLQQAKNLKALKLKAKNAAKYGQSINVTAGNYTNLATSGVYTEAEMMQMLKDIELPTSYDVKTVDAKYRVWSANVWNKSDDAMKQSASRYTRGSGPFNRPLSSWESDPNWANWQDGKFNPLMDLDHEGGADNIVALYDMLNDSRIPEPVRVRRGGKLPELFHPDTGLFKESIDSVRTHTQDFIGKEIEIDRFLSTGIARGRGFQGDVDYDILLPASTKAIYAEPFSVYADDKAIYGPNWSGNVKKTPYSIGSEAEIIVQTNTRYIITDLSIDYNDSVKLQLVAIPDSQNQIPTNIEKYMSDMGLTLLNPVK